MLQIAHAQQAASGASGSGLLFNLLPIVLIVILFYFMLIRPQQKRTKQHREMLNSLQVDQEVVTVGGVLGRVSEIHESFVTLDIGKGQMITFQKQSIQTLLPKGTIEGI